MIRAWIRRHIPTADQLDGIPVFHRFKPWLSHPGLWAINRRAVAGGVAAGLFCGLIPGPFQVLGTLVWCLVAKVNLPVAILVTIYTNPLTIVPLYVFAVAYGQFLLGELEHTAPPVLTALPEMDWSQPWAYAGSFLDWMLSLGPALGVGLPASMFTFSLTGYVLVRLLWHLGLRLAVVKRRRRRIRRQSQTH